MVRGIRAGLGRAWLAGLLITLGIRLWGGGDEVLVVYNTQMSPDSRMVAEHYAQQRGVPSRQVIGLNLPRTETMTRAEFSTRLQRPLMEAIDQGSLIRFHSEIVPTQGDQPGRVIRHPVAATVRYVVLCYGVPVRILEDAKASNTNKTMAPGQRRGAAVDSELALLPLLDEHLPLEGMLRNPMSGASDLTQLHPKNGILMVTRLDGPSGSVARNLIDSALCAETNGLWGRAYFDARGIAASGYKRGDDWILAAAEAARRQGFETVLDQEGATFARGFPFAQVALYAGWYDQAPSGPFRDRAVEFMPGAIAYHIFSYSAQSIRTTNTWVGCLLDKGATATVGYVAEPYLDATIDVGGWFSRLIETGATFGEAAYAALPCLSWQTTVIGDPLYRPSAWFASDPSSRMAALPRSLIPWVRLREANQRLVHGDSPAQVAEDLARDSETRASAVLEQKTGDLYEQAGDPAKSVEAYRRALAQKPSLQQRFGLQLGVARLLSAQGRPAEAIKAYDQFAKQNPKYPGLLGVYRKALALAQGLSEEPLIRRYEAEIKRLTPRTTNAPAPAAPDPSMSRPPS